MDNLSEPKRRNVLANRPAASALGLAPKAAKRAADARSGAAQGDNAIPPLRINVSEGTLVDLRRRLAATRWPQQEAVNNFSQGMQLAKTADARSSMSQDKPVVFVVDDDRIRPRIAGIAHPLCGLVPESFRVRSGILLSPAT